MELILFGNMDQRKQVGGERRVVERARVCGRQRRGRPRAVISDEIKATIIDHVVNHGLFLREADLRVQPNLHCSTVASIHYCNCFVLGSKGCLQEEGEAESFQMCRKLPLLTW